METEYGETSGAASRAGFIDLQMLKILYYYY